MIEQAWSDLIKFSAQFIVPDWGSLVALIPIGLAALVFLYVTWTIYRFATAGPTRRGKRRLAPVAPAGIHMPGPSFAPILAAVGLFFTVFGMVAGGIWLLVGVPILAITLLYWGREEMRNFDRIPALEAGHGPPAGALPAPSGTPPEGVHMPPPSFRPLLVAVGLTILVGSLVIGGWALVFGFIAIVVTLVGWLWDARREYAAVVAADRTGHLDLGGAPSWPKATFAALALIVVVALLLTTKIVPDNGATASAAPAGSGAAPAAPAGGSGAPASGGPSEAPKADVTITAKGIAFTTTAVTIPAGKAFTLAFDNQDSGTLHDILIKAQDGTTAYHTTPLLTGPAVKVYDVPAIAAGQYTFACTVHPAMQGTITAQ
jgi:plastocyanin